ncbi:MAG TPA: HD domain-containing phosphohydrolase [Baekduia sp.]|nr:HD domain-containing phosphohydrolase [Baekduia sp.]
MLGVLLAVVGAALVTSRRFSEQARVDRMVATTSGEKAARVNTELERVRALALVTARIPPFAELYADAGSQAAAIAAVAGPGREINNALSYLWRLYPDRFVEVGYVDRRGAENARVVRGVASGICSPARPARIVAAVDAYSAMTSTRAYQHQRTGSEAIAELRRCAGTHFDPKVVDAYIHVLDAEPDRLTTPSAA